MAFGMGRRRVVCRAIHFAFGMGRRRVVCRAIHFAIRIVGQPVLALVGG